MVSDKLENGKLVACLVIFISLSIILRLIDEIGFSMLGGMSMVLGRMRRVTNLCCEQEY